MALLRLTGPWGEPADGIRLLVLAAGQAEVGGLVAALVIENVGASRGDAPALLAGTTFVDEKPFKVGLRPWDGNSTIGANGVWVDRLDSTKSIRAPGTYKIRYEVGAAKSNTVTVEVK